MSSSVGIAAALIGQCRRAVLVLIESTYLVNRTLLIRFVRISNMVNVETSEEERGSDGTRAIGATGWDGRSHNCLLK